MHGCIRHPDDAFGFAPTSLPSVAAPLPMMNASAAVVVGIC